MARQKSEDTRNAILAAAVQVLVQDGLKAPTSAIARQAGVAHGSLFNYFGSKDGLYNELYITLKAGMADAAVGGISADAGLRDRFEQAWCGWMRWALANPEHRRALDLLGVSSALTDETREHGHRIMAPVAAMMEQARTDGPLRSAPLSYVAGLMNAVADATMDAMLSDPGQADARSREGFSALWRVLR